MVQNVVPILRSESTTKILKAVSPLLISVEQDLRLLVCDLINALAEVDSSILCVVKFKFFICIQVISIGDSNFIVIPYPKRMILL